MAEPIEFDVTLPWDDTARAMAVSPDGRHLAVSGGEALWVRSLDSSDLRRLLDLGGGRFGTGLAWSPDSRWIGVANEQNRLLKQPLAGGPALALVEDRVSARSGLAWGPDGRILASGPGNAIQLYSEAGGEPKTVVEAAEGYETARFGFQFLPAGDRFLFSEGIFAPPEHAGVYVGALNADPPIRLLPNATNAAFASFETGSAQGVLLYVVDQMLLARYFDSDELQFVGEPVVLSSKIGRVGQIDNWAFAISPGGILAYSETQLAYSRPRRLAWLDRDGKVIDRLSLAGVGLDDARLSPAGNQVAYVRLEDGNYDLWVYDLERGSRTRLTRDPARERYPAWAPDGQRLVFSSYRSGVLDLYTVNSDGTGESLIETTPEGEGDPDWASDGTRIVFTRHSAGARGLWFYETSSGDRAWTAQRFPESTGGSFLPKLSPNGRYVAYSSRESGRLEVYVEPFPGGGRRTTVSTGGMSDAPAARIRWRGDGRELLYEGPDRSIMSVRTSTDGDFTAATPMKLFQLPQGASGFDISPDSRRFLVFLPDQGDGSEGAAAPDQNTVHVIVNWQARIRQLLEASGQQP